MILSVQNTLDQLPETLSSYLSANVSAGGTIVPLRNINGINVQWSQQIGRTGEEQTEIVNPINISNGTALYNSGTTKFDHPLDTPVYQIHYDSIIFSRSITGTIGTNSPIGTVPLTTNSLFTQYNDTTGVGTYAYKTQYYNSVSGDISSESDWFVPSSNPTYYSLQKMRQRTKDALYSANYLKSDDVVTDWINEWLELMTNAAIKVNQGYSLGTTNVSFGTAGLGTITDSTFKNPVKVELTSDGINYYTSTEIPINQFGRTDIFSNVYPRHFWQGDSVLGVLPYGSIGTATITFSQRNTPLVNDSDELPLSLRSYTVSCVNYALYRAYANDTKPDNAEEYYNKFLQSKDEFIKEVTPRDQTGIKTIDFTEGISGMNEGILIGSDWVW